MNVRNFEELKCLQINNFAIFILTGCVPTKCGRAVLDNVVSEKESDQLLALAKKGFAKGGGSGGASILDLHSGAISKVSTQMIVDAIYTNVYRSITSYSFETTSFYREMPL